MHPLIDKSEKSTTTAIKKLEEKAEKIVKKFGQIEVKSFIMKHF